jgi:hypothetical protein
MTSHTKNIIVKNSRRIKEHTLFDILVNTNESRIRIGLQEAEDVVREESEKRKNNYPLSVEEQLLQQVL